MCNIGFLILKLCLTSWVVSGMPEGNVEAEPVTNTSEPNKDMYIIHAMVYQVGILTNKTDDGAANANMRGNQEAVTFYHSNGSNIDLSNIPSPLMTNITAQRMVGVAPTSGGVNTADDSYLPWTTLDQLASLPQPSTNVNTSKKTGQGHSCSLGEKSNAQKRNEEPRPARASDVDNLADTDDSGNPQETLPCYVKLMKRSVESPKNEDTSPVKVVKGTVVIPQDAGVQSIAIPPLLTLNNNFSEIPVPIPNTSVVHYAKVNTAGSDMSSPKPNERCTSSMSNGKKHLSNDSKEDSLDNSIRESVKSERKSEEDWRKRTIIVEKKNGSYGFTLQSYGIHYKKEQEIEVITYVDHVETDGPAAVAGMREGDVILSINGADVERADHAAIVDAINACDVRMRMVVIFEDCVRKVELHLKYINLQRAIQSKMRELEQLTVRERQLFDTNWKTHSLPSQKKKISPSDVISDTEENNAGDNNVNNAYCRPTLSSENVTAAKPPQANVFMYQYLDHRYGACVIQPNLRTGSFVITVGSPRNRRECHHYVVKTPGECHRAEAYKASNGKHAKVHTNNHSHGCAPCIPVYNNQDANSLEAYDLASPCCDPHCVPNSKKKVRRKKECFKEHKRKEKCQQVDKSTQKPDNSAHNRSKKVCSSGHCSSRYRYLTTESTQTSQCSLQSYATSTATVPRDNSASSYSTSLSSDTLFWDNDRSEAKASPKIQYQSSHQQVKPKSWDNLTTKAFGGYGFGYGYLDTSAKHANRSKSHGRNHSGRATQSHHEYQHHTQEKHAHRQSATPHHYSVYGRSHSHCAPTKSTESLIVVPKYQLESSGSESRLACECAESVEYYRRVHTNTKNPGASENNTSGYYSQHFIYPTHSYKKKDSNASSEITRL